MEEGESLLQAMQPEHRDAVLGIARSCRTDRSEVLFTEGQAGAAMFVLEEGAVRLHKSAEDGRDVPIRVVRPGELFGEVVLSGGDYPVTATVIRRSVVLRLECRRFRELLDERGFRDDFISVLLRKERYLAERIRQLTSDDAERRLLGFLKDIAGDRIEFEMPMSKQDVALAINTTPETLSRLVTRLRERGILEWRKRRVCLTLPESFSDPSP